MSVSLANGVSLLYNKELVAGSNITFSVTPTTVTINATGGGGGVGMNPGLGGNGGQGGAGYCIVITE